MSSNEVLLGHTRRRLQLGIWWGKSNLIGAVLISSPSSCSRYTLHGRFMHLQCQFLLPECP